MSGTQGNSPTQRQQMTPLVNRINRGGGFSVRAVGDQLTDTGYLEYAKDGYMVGVPGHGKDFNAGTITTKDLSDHINANRAILSRNDHFLGGWQGENPTRGSVDVAKRFPRGERGSRSAAKVMAARGNQEAIGVVGPKAEYLGEIKNPNYVAGASQEGRELTVKDAEWAFPRSTGPRAASSRQGKMSRKR